MQVSNFNNWIKQRRQELHLPLRKVAAYIDLDQSTLSKIERGERLANFDLIKPLSEILEIDHKKLEQIYLSDKVISIVEYSENAIEILKAAEQRIKYNIARKNG